MKRAFVLGLVLLSVLPFARAGIVGAYVGEGRSYQFDANGYCAADGPTVTELRQLDSASWSFDTVMAIQPGGCDGFGVGVGSFTSLDARGLQGSPESGIHGKGDYYATYPGGYTIHVFWNLTIGPVGPGTTWTILTHVEDPVFGPYDGGWTGTMDFVGAHA